MRLWRWLKHHGWRLAALLGLLLAAVGVSLYFSMRSYKLSLNRQEVMIAKVKASDYSNDPVEMGEEGELRIYYWMPGGVTDRKIKAEVNNKSESKVMAMETYWDTGLAVDSGDEVQLEIFEGEDFKVEASGWVEPNDDDSCGLGSYRKQTIVKLQGILDDHGETVEQIMCWTDNELPDGLTLDFNDFVVALTYTGDGGGSSDSDDDDDKDSGAAKFVIRSFRDLDHNGVWDSNEKALGLKVYYDYHLNDGGWSGYSTDAETGWGETKEGKDGDKVGIRRRELSGWESQKGLEVEGDIDGDKTTYFDFGYYPAGEVVSTQGYDAPAQPATGVSTWLTLSALGLLGASIWLKLRFL